MTENQAGKRLKVVRSDRGGEIWSNDFKEFSDDHGIKREYTILGTPQHKMEWLRDRIEQFSKWQDQ